MSALILRNHSHNNITIVENDFIDHYMVSANGEYVKVYLLLLRYQNIPEQLPDIPQMADLLENTEGDILRALKYWEKEGILSLEYDETNELAGICIGKAPTHQTPVKAAFHTPSAQSASVHEKSPVAQSDGNTTVSDKTAGQNLPASRRSLAARRELKQILFIAEQYLGKTLSRTDVDAITYFYDSLGFSADLIEYLIEYCVENGHKSMHYIQKVALSWADEHITTVDQARNSSAFYNKTCYSILNAFGIKGRGPASAELILSANGWGLGISNWISFWKHATAPSVRFTSQVLNILTRFSKTGRRATFVHWQMLSVLILPLSRKKTGGKLLRGKTVHLLPSSLPNSVILKNVLTIWTSLPKNYYAVTKKGEHCAVN